MKPFEAVLPFRRVRWNSIMRPVTDRPKSGFHAIGREVHEAHGRGRGVFYQKSVRM